jgi:hypothetical protein
VVRLSVAAKHLGEPVTGKAIFDCIDLALLHGSRPMTYRDMTPAALGRAA